MNYRLQKVAVLGSGVMGSGIACHLANIGLDVVLLDILPFDLKEEDKNKKILRDSVANGALKAALKSKPAPLYSKKFASRIQTGNFDDDLHLIADADWVIEVIIENLEIKKTLFEKVESHVKPDALVSSNTSSIPIHLLVEGRSEDFKKRFCGTHFFNPPRYMSLLEIIPHDTTDAEVIDFFMEYGDSFLGKDTVLCKDTPAFIANRIGVMSGAKMYQLTEKYDMKIEEVDALTGPLIGRPKTATFKLQDLVGIDTGDKVSRFVSNNTPGDPFFEEVKKAGNPKFIDFLLENKFLGNKTKKGFYVKTKERDEKGKSIYLALDLKTHEYNKAIKPRMESVGEARKIEIMSKRLDTLVSGTAKGNLFLKEYFASLFSYTALRVPEISDSYYSIDDAMRAGYRWSMGPFELWDELGMQKGIDLLKEQGEAIPDWVQKMNESGATSFYKNENGQKLSYDLSTSSYVPVASTQGMIILDTLRDKTPVLKNTECTVHDIGDGVMCLEFQTKSNAIGEGIGQGLHEAIQKAENEGWTGVVVGNNAENFTVGANIMNVGMFAMQKQFDKLDEMVNSFQQICMYMRTSKVPVVNATQGYVFGGGCEMTMHANGSVCAAESYIGLVEVGVGLLPGGGGTKEMALRASDKYFEGDVKMPTLIDHFKPIATAEVATSAWEAYEKNLLLNTKDNVTPRTPKNINLAKDMVIDLAKNYVAPVPRKDVTVLGRGGLATLHTAINEFRLGNYMSDYDVEIARKVAFVMCGGDLTSAQKVSEQYLLDLEREAFLSLLGNQKTLDRIQYMLMNNRPLRN